MQANLSATQDNDQLGADELYRRLGIALPISGWLADKVGRKRLLLISVVRLHGRLGAVRDGDVAW